MNDLTRAFPKDLVSWTRPIHPNVKLNTDGAAKGNLGLAEMGYVIRDSAKRCLVGATINLGITTSVNDELWGVQ